MPNAPRISRSIPMPLVPLVELLEYPKCPKCPPRTASVSKSPLAPPSQNRPIPTWQSHRAASIVCIILHTKPFRPHHANPHSQILSHSDCPRAIGNALAHICAGAIGICRKGDVASHHLLVPSPPARNLKGQINCVSNFCSQIGDREPKR